jgi:hypothetical protein
VVTQPWKSLPHKNQEYFFKLLKGLVRTIIQKQNAKVSGNFDADAGMLPGSLSGRAAAYHVLVELLIGQS